MDTKVEITSFSDFEFLVKNKLRDTKLSNKQRDNIKSLMMFAFKIGGELAVNKRVEVKL